MLICNVDAAGIAADQKVADQGQAHEEQEHDDSQGAGVVELGQREGGLVDVGDQKLGGVAGAAAGHDVDEIEAGKGRNDADDEAKEDRGAQERQGDPPELAPAAGAVDRGRLVEIGRDALQPGEQDDHEEAHH